MPLIYSVVARGTTILAEHSMRGTTTNFAKVIQRILEKIPPTDGRMSYVFENHYFHYLVDDGITYMCMAEEAFGRRLPFAFLDELKNRFKATYGDRGKTALSFAMQADFSRIMQNLMEFYSNAANADKITKLKGQMEEVKSIMITNIEKVLERGEKIELLVEKTDQLNQTAVQFKKKSTGLKQAMWWKNFKLTLLLVLIALFIIYIIIAIVCRGIIFQGCWSSSSPTPSPQPHPSVSQRM